MVLGKFNTDLVIFADLSVPLPEGEDEAPAADSKDTADEKLDGKWSRNLPVEQELCFCVSFCVFFSLSWQQRIMKLADFTCTCIILAKLFSCFNFYN